MKRLEPATRRFLFRGEKYVLRPIGPDDPCKIARQEGSPEGDRPFDPSRWVVGMCVERADRPGDPLGFYAVSHSGDPNRMDDTLAFVAPRARGKRLSALLIYGVYLELLKLPGPFVLCEVIDHPQLRLHARCGFAPPVRPLRDGKVEVGNFDLHTVLSRIESEGEIQELSGDA